MTDYLPAIIAVAITAFAVVSKRLGRSVVTGTMVFTALGLVVGPEVLDLVDFTGLLGEPEFVRLVLTGALVVVLFTDASAINASRWSDDVVAARLLGIGLPLAIAFGWLAALVLLGDLEVWEAALLAAMLAPTDAALGKAVVSNPRVPARIRQALNIESGLNDGIVLPFFIVFLETARAAESFAQRRRPGHRAGGRHRHRRGHRHRGGRVRGTGGPVGAYQRLREPLLAPGRPAVARRGCVRDRYPARRFGFHRRLGRRAGVRQEQPGSRATPTRRCCEFSEIMGDLLTMVSFFVFGVYLGPVFAEVTWQIVAYAVVSLVVVRFVAVVISLAGGRMRRSTLLYIGWFGPRGLATIILTIEIVDASDLTTARPSPTRRCSPSGSACSPTA